MTNKVLVIALGVAALLVVPLGDPAHAADRRDRTLELRSYKGRPVGGYSYKNPDVASTYGRSPPPWLGVRQSPGGPFDSGFFFDSGIPRGDNSPYPR
jgi:hypothetical protein